MSTGEIDDYNSIVQNYRLPSMQRGYTEESRRKNSTESSQNDYGSASRDGNPHSQDMERALSDMRKDQVLRRYQYFVGDSDKRS